MFARQITVQLKPNTAQDFSRMIDSDLIPILRKSSGFKDELVFVNSGATGAVAISLWDSKENADNYTRTTYPEVLKTFSKVIEGTPKFETYHVSNSTLHVAPLPAKV